jgi:cardiolipin synthase
VVAFTGGVNISRVYSSGSLSAGGHEKKIEEAWRDTHVQIEGPAVAEFQKLFLDTWARLIFDSCMMFEKLSFNKINNLAIEIWIFL